MPRFDGTGPMGSGEMTGRGTGYCMGFYSGQRGDYGANLRRGSGYKRGNRGMYKLSGLPGWARYANERQEGYLDEEKLLKNQAQLLENQLKQVNGQLKKLKEGARDSERVED